MYHVQHRLVNTIRALSLISGTQLLINYKPSSTCNIIRNTHSRCTVTTNPHSRNLHASIDHIVQGVRNDIVHKANSRTNSNSITPTSYAQPSLLKLLLLPLKQSCTNCNRCTSTHNVQRAQSNTQLIITISTVLPLHIID